MRRVILVGCLLLLAGAAAPAAAAGPGEDRDVAFDQHLGAQVPLQLAFRDESGEAVELGSYFTGRPVVLTLNYYTCQDLCPLTLQGLAAAFAGLPFSPGTDYTAVTVSIDPRDTPAAAAAAKRSVLAKHPRAAAGWHFLTGNPPMIALLAQAVGYRYVYDSRQNSFAHPEGAIVLTPGGSIARYLFGMDFVPNDLRLALVEASSGAIGSPVDEVLLLCFHYDEKAGRYTGQAMAFVRAGAITTAALLGLLLASLWRRERSRAGNLLPGPRHPRETEDGG